jgi:hypothetical protein
MAADIAQRNPGRNDRLEIGSIDRKFGMRRIVVRFQLCAWCLVPERWLTRTKSPHSTSREKKPSPPARRQMCEASHILPAAAGTRLSLSVSFDARRTRSQGRCVSKMWRFEASIEAQARNRTCGFEGRSMPIRSRRDWTAGAKRAPRQITPTAANAFDVEGKAGMRRANSSRRSGRPMSLQQDWLPGLGRRSRRSSRNRETRPSLGPGEILFSVSNQ